MPDLREYHFSLGNSTTGPIGFCARVKAYSEEEAVDVLRNSLPREISITPAADLDADMKRVIYIEAYLNPDVIRKEDIDEICQADGRAIERRTRRAKAK